MKLFSTIIPVLLSVILSCHITYGQLPPRLSIPGAVLLSQARPAPFRQQRIQGDGGPPPRLRRPIPNGPPPSIRPVVEEAEEPPATLANNNNFDDEVSKLGISVLQSAVRQAVTSEEEEAPRPVHFRPERPVPVLRQDIRENASPRPAPVLRQEQRENIPRTLVRQEPREDFPVPVRQPQPVRHSQPRQHQQSAQPPPQLRQVTRGHHQPAKQPSQFLDDENGRQGRKRKPTVQILRKYRTDNADGSITWGFENEDGTFKEETLGVDCITRGKYGYVDPDGVRRQYSYETGNKCDEQEEAEEELVLPAKQPQLLPRNKPQFRPLPPQI